eukprot:COSAG01_NODE_15269_length_1355_cov_19.509554_2_plen_75_part_00
MFVAAAAELLSVECGGGAMPAETHFSSFHRRGLDPPQWVALGLDALGLDGGLLATVVRERTRGRRGSHRAVFEQ